MKFLTFLVFLLLGFYLLQWLARLWLRRRIARIRHDMEQNGGQGFYKQYTWGGRSNGRPERPAREGEVKVETGAAPGKKLNDRIGDYVDYEEVGPAEDSRQAK